MKIFVLFFFLVLFILIFFSVCQEDDIGDFMECDNCLLEELILVDYDLMDYFFDYLLDYFFNFIILFDNLMI